MQFCDTSFKHGKLSAELAASYHCVLRFFHPISLTYFYHSQEVLPCLMEMSLVLRLPRNACYRSSSNVARPHRFGNCYKTYAFCSHWARCKSLAPTCHKMPLERPKVVRECDAFSILTSKRVSGANDVHF